MTVICRVEVFVKMMIILKSGVMVLHPENIRTFLGMTNGRQTEMFSLSLIWIGLILGQRVQELRHVARLWNLLWLHDLRLSLSEITSYPREWRDGTRSGKYSYIPVRINDKKKYLVNLNCCFCSFICFLYI